MSRRIRGSLLQGKHAMTLLVYQRIAVREACSRFVDVVDCPPQSIGVSSRNPARRAIGEVGRVSMETTL